jgi:hypothetical protein
MSALNFPDNPASVGNVYVGDNGVTYDYVNGKWRGRTAAGGGGGNANTGDWVWDNNTAGTPANVDLQLKTVSTATQHAYSFWISEYGGLGANTNNAYAYGTGGLYDSQGNLYIIGTAGDDNNPFDSLMLKYDPLGNLIWHKTWHDSVNNNCGAANVAIAMDGTDRIYWIANNWGDGGCWFGYMDTDGNLGLGGTSQEVIGFPTVWPSDLACDNEHAYIAGQNYVSAWDINVPFIAKVNGNTGVITWANNLISTDTNGSTCTGWYRAITVDPNNGAVFAIGDYNDVDGTWAMLSKWDSAGTQQWTNKLVTSITDRGEAVVYNNGSIYTVVNDSAETKTVVSKFNTDGTLVWASNLAVGSSSGYDLSFDAVHNVYVTGIIEGQLWLTKVDPDTGVMLYSRVVQTSLGVTIADGTSDPLVGHRVGDIFENRIAITAMTHSDLSQAGSFNSRIIVSQLPIDGSIVGTFSNVVISDATLDIAGISSTGTYSLSTLTWDTQDLGTGLSTLSQLSASNVTVASTMTNKTITMAAGPVIGIVETTSTWKFSSTGDLVLPAGGAIAAKDNGAVTIKAGDETAYWWSEYGDLLIDNQDDWGSSVEYDSHGNVYIVGGTYHNIGDNSTNIQALLVKYSPTGELLWQKAMFDQDVIWIRGEGLWIDSADNLFMIVQNDEINLSYLLKLDTEGNVVWQVQMDPTPDNSVGVIDIDGDNQGHVYIVGRQNYVNNDERSEPWVACYDTTDGTCIWQQHVDITGALYWSNTAYGIAVGVEPLPAVYITGQAYISNQWQAFLVSMDAESGTLNWSNQLYRNDGWYSSGNDVAVDAHGAVYVVGENSSGLEISKWSSAGSLAWAKVMDKFGDSGGNSLDFDRDGYLYITGYNGNAGNTGNNGWLVIKMDQTGAIIWQNILGSPVNNIDQWYYDGHKEIAVNSVQNSLVITGYTYVGTTATIRESLYNSNMLTAQFPLDGTMTGTFGNFFYTPTTLVMADSNVYASIVSTVVTSSTYAMSTSTIATISNDEVADTHHLTGDTWQFTTDGHIILPPNGDIIDGGTGESVLGKITNSPHVARLDDSGVLVDQNGRSVTGELNRRTDTGDNFSNTPIAIRNASGYKRLVGLNSSPQTWLDLTDVANQIGINRYWITGMVLEYQAQNTNFDYNGSMVGQIIIASNEIYEMTVSHTESAITRSNNVNDVVFANLDLWRIDGTVLQAARTDNRTGQQLDIIWTARVFFNASEAFC